MICQQLKQEQRPFQSCVFTAQNSVFLGVYISRDFPQTQQMKR